MTVETDFKPLYDRIAGLPDIEIGEIVESDVVLTEGTQEYALSQSGEALVV